MTAQTVETHPAPVLGDLDYSTVPANLTPAELHAYRAGYTRGARNFIKKNGGPGVVHNGDAPAAGTAARKMLARQLAEQGRAHRVECHPVAHKSGMSALRSYLRKIGATDRLAQIVDPCAPVKATRKPRKSAARIIPAPEPVATPEPAPDPVDVVAAAVDSGRVVVIPVGAPDNVPAPMPKMTHAAKKASNRELAEKMRAAGVPITVETWAAAKAGADLSSLVGA